MPGSGEPRYVGAMRYVIALAALTALSFTAAPAHATGGFHCRTASEPKIEISVGFGHVVGTPIFGERLSVDGKDIPVEAPQWWLDDSELRLLLTDKQANERLAVVRATRNGDTYDGSVTYKGKRYWIRCYEG